MAPESEQEIRELRSRFWSERDPDGRAFAPLADACRRAGALREAVELLEDGLARHPSFVSGHVVAAWVHRDGGDLVAAEDAFRRALELDPENARALHGLGQLLARAGRLAAGRELVRRAVELDPHLEWEEGGAPTLLRVPGDAGEAQSAVPPGAEAALEATPLDAAVQEGPAHDTAEGAAPDAPGPEEHASDQASDVVAAAPGTADRAGPAPSDAAELGIRGAEPAELHGAGPDAAVAEPTPPDTEVVDVRALAPGDVEGVLGDPDGRGPIVAIEALAPSAAEPEPATALTEWSAPWAEAPPADAAPDERGAAELEVPVLEEPETVVDIGELAPEPVTAKPGARQTKPEEAEDQGEQLHYTRTMAELLARQGLREQALEVVRHLRRRDPDDDELATREQELSAPSRMEARSGEAAGVGPADVDIAARPVAMAPATEPGEAAIPGPLAGTEGGESPTDEGDAGSIEAYLQGLLAWPSRRAADADERPDHASP